MEYIREAHGSMLLPKLLGTYELEIQGVIEKAIDADYPLVVDIGCAEGYYAVGMALRLPHAAVVAFERDAGARKKCRALATLNGVADRVDICEAFHPGDAQQFAGRRALVICDVDGYETEIFRPEHAWFWRSADLLVELHDCGGLPCREAVLGTLQHTHRPTLFPAASRSPSDSPLTARLRPEDRSLAVNELRAHQEWVYLQAA
jgi:hypothetical protein